MHGLFLFLMRYHYIVQNKYVTFGRIHYCNHPVYSSCTLFTAGEIGLAVIQQRYDPITKHTWWGPIDSGLNDILYTHPKFKELFNQRAKNPAGDIFPTIALRQLMWALRMKPLQKEPWETVFDRKDI